MHVTGIDWTAVIYEDYPAARQFFSEKLGLPLAFEAKKHVISHFRLPSGQLLELYGPSNRERRYEKFRWFNGHALGFAVDDLEAAHQTLIDREVHFIHGIERWQNEAWAMFLGPENKLLQIQTPGRHAPEQGALLSGFSWSGMVVQDFAAAVDFFVQTMELPLANLDQGQSSAQFLLPDRHLLQIIGPSHPWSKTVQHITVGFEVEDLGQVKSELEQKGVRFSGDIQTSAQNEQIAFFHGPDNYPYALWRPSKPK